MMPGVTTGEPKVFQPPGEVRRSGLHILDRASKPLEIVSGGCEECGPDYDLRRIKFRHVPAMHAAEKGVDDEKRAVIHIEVRASAERVLRKFPAALPIGVGPVIEQPCGGGRVPVEDALL